MPILNSAIHLQDEVSGWRRWLHQRPEVAFDLPQTTGFVAAKLAEFGCDAVFPDVGGSGIVAIIKGRLGDGPTIGLRADMDALPVTEESGVPHASLHAGKMHACGHDGHTAMLLGAARHLAETRNFAGSVALIFQPAEEIGQGAAAMLADGLMERFSIARVFGMHNIPGIAVGRFAVCSGPAMGSVGKFTITVNGKGGHAARPHQSLDPIVACAQIVTALQTIVARQTDPLSSVVLTVTRVVAGTAYNIIPETAEIWGTVRTLDMAEPLRVEQAVRTVCAGIAQAGGIGIDVDFTHNVGVTFNPPAEAAFAAGVARDVAGDVDEAPAPILAGEDFSRMLEQRPGAFVFIGNGDTAGLHHPAYEFDDAAIPAGVSFWVRLVEKALPG